MLKFLFVVSADLGDLNVELADLLSVGSFLGGELLSQRVLEHEQLLLLLGVLILEGLVLLLPLGELRVGLLNQQFLLLDNCRLLNINALKIIDLFLKSSELKVEFSGQLVKSTLSILCSLAGSTADFNSKRLNCLVEVSDLLILLGKCR